MALQYFEDLAPRLLFIECGKSCQLDSLCSNKRFQTQENAAIEVDHRLLCPLASYFLLQVFKTDWKGFGLRAMVPLPSGTFLMEYVGEVGVNPWVYYI